MLIYKSKINYSKYRSGFTLIELLVVIAIIGILSSVVLASLNSARQKGQIAAIKSNLKNMIPQAQLAYDTPGNYSTACASIDSMKISINNNGGTAACFSYSTGIDTNTRWGVSAKLNSDNTKNWSVDSLGVVTWDNVDISASMLNWADANSTCLAVGGRVPSYEELLTLFTVHGITPPGFNALDYWSGSTHPYHNGSAYMVHMGTGAGNYPAKSALHYVRCVR